ncbi:MULTISPECIES: flagellar biosynthetic protein FliO [unclassified Gilliamella]|uniref:flagellar biosynthetic protein FliO n=1 Tax=unclassified Gilliamella TaxID=2685620 RepID=UPI00080DF7CC|nr:flagellar biosynthetic protein FliO [Gilliamella apicola]OCG33343.1 flagellar biosynthetic protein FliO [Gilliamella apicola]OCG48958.1 flagellar biosynthetic protein FliO [Gilliamella apicola]OCG50426.1 flagellar biosynthetic protein FliO [Gilliamella apicola]
MTIKQPNLIQPMVGATNTNTLSPSSSDLNIYTEIGSSMGLTLIVIIGFILLLGWLAKRMGWKKTTEQWIDVKATYNINPKERIMVIHVDNQLLVVGVTPQQMTLLHTINEERTKVLLSQNGADKNLTKINSFQQILQSALKVKKE